MDPKILGAEAVRKTDVYFGRTFIQIGHQIRIWHTCPTSGILGSWAAGLLHYKIVRKTVGWKFGDFFGDLKFLNDRLGESLETFLTFCSLNQ